MPWVIELETDLDQLCMQFLNFFNGSLAIFTFFSFLYVNMFFFVILLEELQQKTNGDLFPRTRDPPDGSFLGQI